MPVRRPLPSGVATFLGVLSIAFWSTSVAFSRDLAERLGVLTSSALIYAGGGGLGIVVLIVTGRLRQNLGAPLRYLLASGALFVLYLVAFCLAIGLAKDGRQVIEVGLINYLWPALTLVFSIPLLGNRATPWLVPGIGMALSGIVLAALGDQPLALQTLADSGRAFLDHLTASPWPYGLSLAGAVSWALYSNLVRRWTPVRGESPVSIFLFVSGVVLGGIRLWVPEESVWSLDAGCELVYMILFPALLAYLFWDLAMRVGRMVWVASLSYLIPLVSTLLVCVLQDLAMGLNLWLACGLLAGGAVVCRLGVREPVG